MLKIPNCVMRHIKVKITQNILSLNRLWSALLKSPFIGYQIPTLRVVMLKLPNCVMHHVKAKITYNILSVKVYDQLFWNLDGWRRKLRVFDPWSRLTCWNLWDNASRWTLMWMPRWEVSEVLLAKVYWTRLPKFTKH